MCIRDSNETLSKRVDDYEKEVRQQITETKVGLEKTDETIIQLGVEVEAKINQVENSNKTRIKEVQIENQGKLDEVQINIAGRIEIVNNEITQIKTQVDQNKGTVENIQNQELINIKESIEILQNRPMYLAHHIDPDKKENINFKIYRGNPIEFLGRIDEWFGRIKVTRWNIIKNLLDDCFKSINDNWWSAV